MEEESSPTAISKEARAMRDRLAYPRISLSLNQRS
jgi:hypothetical protein